MNNNEQTPKRLIFFRGHIVDKRHNEFRKIFLQNGRARIQFIPFHSRKGQGCCARG
jgi:hypothetical protein